MSGSRIEVLNPQSYEVMSTIVVALDTQLVYISQNPSYSRRANYSISITNNQVTTLTHTLHPDDLIEIARLKQHEAGDLRIIEELRQIIADNARTISENEFTIAALQQGKEDAKYLLSDQMFHIHDQRTSHENS
jgi:hypothetical protein